MDKETPNLRFHLQICLGPFYRVNAGFQFGGCLCNQVPSIILDLICSVMYSQLQSRCEAFLDLLVQSIELVYKMFSGGETVTSTNSKRVHPMLEPRVEMLM